MQPVVAESKHTTVTFDGVTITIDRGGLARRGRDAYTLAQVSGIQLSPPRFGQAGGRFTLVLAGGVQRGSARTSKLSSAADDPLTVIFSKSRLPQFQALAQAITAALAAGTQPTPPAQSAAPDLAGQLQRLAEMHATGVLSDAEFANAKQRLIGGGVQDTPPRR